MSVRMDDKPEVSAFREGPMRGEILTRASVSIAIPIWQDTVG
jgi:hypothetical protein